jgi:methionyl-tRNA formyltransferase
MAHSEGAPDPALSDRWRVMFLGQGPLAEFAYEQLVDATGAAGLRVVVACSNALPENTWWGTARIRELASVNSTRFISNSERHDSLLAETAAELGVNCLISVGHPWIVPERLLRSTDENAAFNLHNGPLPRFGGFNTGSHAILEGVTHFGPTLHWMESAVDAGPIAFEERFEIPRDATAKSLHALTQEAGRRLFSRLRECLLEARLPPREPMTTPTRIYSRHALSDHREVIDVSNDVEVDRKSRAFWFPPFEPAFCRLNGRKLYLVPQQGASEIARWRNST